MSRCVIHNIRPVCSKEAGQALQKRLDKEINDLYDRLARGLKEENLRLIEENASLRAEIERLRQWLS